MFLFPLRHSSTSNSEVVFVALLVAFLEFSEDFFRFQFIFDWRIVFCLEYASRVNNFKNVFILGHAVTDVSLMMMVLPLVCFGPFSVYISKHNVSYNLCRPPMNVTMRYNINQEQASWGLKSFEL